jgi:hypothetical protein
LGNRALAYLTFAFGVLFLLFYGVQAWVELKEADVGPGSREHTFLRLSVLYGVFVCVVGVLHGVVAGCVRQARCRRFCLWLAGASALNFACAPVNTAVAVWTIVVLLRREDSPAARSIEVR